tara:strand:+ start:167 stop:340 length:174 start_codon:yes stop_codon:yes gene_type:complete
MKEHILEQIHNYTKYKIVEMLIKKHKDRFEDMETIEDVSEDILDILTLCGLKFYNKS